jgi:hypothetical protein
LDPDGQYAFISYCRVDSEFAHRLAEDLKAGGAAVWLDQNDIRPGEPWDSAVERALVKCTRLILILSPASVASHNVLDEMSYALKQQRKVIPVLFKDCEIPFRLNRIHYVDFRTNYDRGLKELTKALVTQTGSYPTLNALSGQARTEERVRPESVQAKAAQANFAGGPPKFADVPRTVERQNVAGSQQVHSEQKPAAGKSPQGAAQPKAADRSSSQSELHAATPAVRHDTRKTADHKNDKGLYIFAGIAVAIVIFAAITIPMVRKRERINHLLKRSWAEARYDDPDFADCMRVEVCEVRKAQAEHLKQFQGWETIHYDDPILTNCMSYPICLQKRAQADSLRAISDKDWASRKPDDPLFKNCMGYAPCVRGPEPASKTPSAPLKQRPQTENENAPTHFDPYRQ